MGLDEFLFGSYVGLLCALWGFGSLSDLALAVGGLVVLLSFSHPV